MNECFPQVLGFGMEEPQAQSIRMICIGLGIGFTEVPQKMFGEKIGALCGHSPAGAGNPLSPPLREPMLILADLPEPILDAFLLACRKSPVRRPALTACLTETNAAWTPYYLQNHLSEEREAFRQEIRRQQEKKQAAKNAAEEKKEEKT